MYIVHISVKNIILVSIIDNFKLQIFQTQLVIHN
jgi:hypothetical protein